jgi:hypothetical protein
MRIVLPFLLAAAMAPPLAAAEPFRDPSPADRRD